MPGQYDLDAYGPGDDKRPAHIHYKVGRDGFRPLTTQLYFKGDPYLKKDPWARKSLTVELKTEKGREGAGERRVGTFDLVLAKRS